MVVITENICSMYRQMEGDACLILLRLALPGTLPDTTCPVLLGRPCIVNALAGSEAPLIPDGNPAFEEITRGIYSAVSQQSQILWQEYLQTASLRQ
jgi:hypothetical protein